MVFFFEGIFKLSVLYFRTGPEWLSGSPGEFPVAWTQDADHKNDITGHKKYQM